MYECNDKMVSHPSHYQGKNGLEAIDVIESFTSDLSGIEAVDTANILKYVLRWKSKNGLQDLKKAKWYLTHLIEHIEDDLDSSHIFYDECPVFHSLEHAEKILEIMNNHIKKNGGLSVQEFYDFCDLSCVVIPELGSHGRDVYNFYGWKDFHMVTIVKTPEYLYTFDNIPDKLVKVKE